MRVMIIGAGYVGLVTGCCFAEFGFNVVCIDNDQEKVNKLQQGILPIYEPGLQDLLKKNIANKTLNFSTELSAGIAQANVIFIAVGTPSSVNGAVDLSYIYAAAREIAPHLNNYALVIVKSTVPPGTCQLIKQQILSTNSDANFDIVSNPEFLREGHAVRDFMQPDRIVIGLDNPANREMMAKLYRPLQLQNVPIVFTSLVTAELIKYSANAFLATKVAFINEMADLCEKVDADVQVLAYAIGLDERIGSHFLQTGPGYGGSCFPKDTLGLQEFAQSMHAPSKIVNAVIAANQQRKLGCVNKIMSACNGLDGKEIAVLGVAFKANTDDIRESPALEIIEGMLGFGARIRLFDPAAMQNAQNYFGERIRYAQNLQECLCNANAVVILTEWNVFKSLNLQEVANLLCAFDDVSPKVFVDLRNLYNANDFMGLNMRYVSLGRSVAQPHTTICESMHE